MTSVKQNLEARTVHHPLDRGLLGVAAVLLAGLVVTGIGYFGPHRLCLYTGLAVVLAGVLAGAVRLAGRSGRT